MLKGEHLRKKHGPGKKRDYGTKTCPVCLEVTQCFLPFMYIK